MVVTAILCDNDVRQKPGMNEYGITRTTFGFWHRYQTQHETQLCHFLLHSVMDKIPLQKNRNRGPRIMNP